MFDYHFKPRMEEKLRLFSEYGFRYIHWCDDWNNDLVYTNEDMMTFSQLVDSAGLKCLDVHGAATVAIHIDSEHNDPQKAYSKLLENRVEFCSILGGDSVVIHPPRFKAPKLRQRMERSVQVLDSVRPICEDMGVCIAVENCFASDDEILEKFFDLYPPEFVGFCFDSGHANINLNIDKLFMFGDRLKALHLHDNKGDRDDHQPPFFGTIKWDQVLEWIRENEYVKPINFEVTHDPKLFKGTMKEFLEHTVASIGKAMALPR